jgi:alkanesulfonate monooxygenase SsuD/methylene tetrahydromethanopterin reductase-like flavin-dependent oxidoreductase (luciferase family)
VLSFSGKHYRYEDAELHVKPVQKPYPPLWFPSSNRDSIDFTARHGYHTALLGKLADARPLFDRYRELWEKHKSEPGRHNAHVAAPCLAKTQHLVIAEKADEAKRLGEAAHRIWNSHIHHLTRKLGRPDVHNTEAYSPDSAHPLIAGTPAEVTEQLAAFIRATSINYLLCVFSFGDLAPQHALRSLELFAREVMPHFTKD